MKYLGTAAGCILMLFLTLPRHGGFILELYLIFLIPLFIYSGFRMYLQRTERTERGKKLIVWLITIGVVIVVNYHRSLATRVVADGVVTRIVEYHANNKIYPVNLESIGYDKNSLSTNLGLYGYVVKDEKPDFFYAVPYTMFDTYQYNFDSKQWVYIAD